MNMTEQSERRQHALMILSVSALWYAWGQIDAGTHPGLTTDDGHWFQGLYTDLAREYQEERRGSRPSVLSAWAAYVAARKSAPAAAVTPEQLA